MNEEQGAARPRAGSETIAAAPGATQAPRIFSNGLVAWAQACRTSAFGSRHLSTRRVVLTANRTWRNAERGVAYPRAATRTVAAALAALISVSLFSALTSLFIADGFLWRELAAAERACVHYEYLSERQACVRTYLAALDRRVIARR